MALSTISKSISMNATSSINDTTVVEFYATIDSNNIDITAPNRTILDAAKYRENRAVVLTDQKAFEDAVYAVITDLTPKTTNS